MRRVVLGIMMCASLGWTAGASAQQGAPDKYSGVSQPPQDPIEISPDPAPAPAKPAAGVVAQPPAPMTPAPQPSSPGPLQDDGRQAMNTRPAVVDPDGDIVHPRATRPGELMEGSTIRVRIIDRLSSTDLEKGQKFRGQVSSDVMQDGKVLIPAGSSIEGQVSNVSTGNHLGGHGSFRLKPESVTLPDGSRFELHAYATGAPGSKTRMGSEGSINPGSRTKKNSIEYGAVVGTGAVTGAVLGGPVGALTGSLVGAGMVTTHILVDHPQATLEPGAVLLFTLTEPMNLMPPQNN